MAASTAASVVSLGTSMMLRASGPYDRSMIFSDGITDPNSLYQLRRQIGKGSFGKIWVGVKKEGSICLEDEKVAVKILRYEGGNEETNKKLSWEIKIMLDCKGCNHIVQHIGSFLEYKKKHAHLWIVMEYADLGSLRSYLASRGPFPEKAIAPILKQTLQALAFLHKSTTVHRDLKSANILWNSKGEVKLADLGEALVLQTHDRWDDMLSGTPFFMAPEASTGQRYTEKIDIWSLGILALELAEVNPPFFGEAPFKVLFQIASQILKPQLTKPDEWSKEFRDFIASCLQFDSDKRPSAEDLLKHPFIVASEHEYLTKFAKDYAAEIVVNEPAAGAKTQNKDKKIDTTKVIYRDNETGETQIDFFANFLKWKEYNSDTLTALAAVKKEPVKKETDGLTLERSKSTLKWKSFFNVFNAQPDLQNKMERLSLLIQIASKASSTSFGVIVSSRKVDDVLLERCFVGRELVDWIYHHLQLQRRAEAINLVNHLLESNLIFSITEESHVIVDSDTSYFRFQYGKIKEWNESYTKSSAYLGRKRQERVSREEKYKPTDDQVLEMHSPSSELTERDWSLIMSGASPETFAKDDIIVKEGIYNRCIYRVIAGSVRVEKVEKGNTIVLSTMSEGQMFGEMSVLTQGKTSATIRADSTPCQVFITEVSFMYKLFKTEPGMQHRFFQRAAVSLAHKLRELSNVASSPSVAKKPIIELEENDSNSLYDSMNQPLVQVSLGALGSHPPSPKIGSNPSSPMIGSGVYSRMRLEDSPQSNGGSSSGGSSSGDSLPTSPSTRSLGSGSCIRNPRDAVYAKLFNLPSTEVVIEEHICQLAGIIKEHGTLYLSSNYVCFYSKVFGKQTKVAMNIDDIELEVTEKRVLKIKSKKHKFNIVGLMDPHDAVSTIKSLKLSRKASKEKTRVSSSSAEEEEVLSSSDWALLLSESQCKTFTKGQVIVKEGEYVARIHQLAKGSCLVEKTINNKPQKLGTMEAGEIFGEVSFLEGNRTSASVLADDNATEVYIIEGAALSVLFMRQPALCGRFYRYLAQVLSARLKEREKDKKNKK